MNTGVMKQKTLIGLLQHLKEVHKYYVIGLENAITNKNESDINS